MTKDTSDVGYPCQACGRHYETDMLVPDDVWEVIKPEGKDIGAGLLCPTCIMDRASDRLGWSVGFVYPERHGTAVTAGKAAPSSEVVAAAHYRVGNPSAWQSGYDEQISEEIRALLALISSLVAENERLKLVVSLSAEATGALISPKASIDFMEKLPGEIRLNREGAERLLAEARATIAEIADFGPDEPLAPDTVRLIRIAGAARRAEGEP